MKSRSSPYLGVLLCTCFSPLPLQQEVSEPAKIVLVLGPPEFPNLEEFEKELTIFNRDITFFSEDFDSIFSIKPVSWFIHNNISLCTVPTVPYQHGFVHKPPWGGK